MVRPCASQENKALGILFANIVTVEVPSESPVDTTVPRSGEHSIYEIFKRCFRRCVRDNSRNGLSHMEMNKVLEKSGFLRIRIRNAVRKKDKGRLDSDNSPSSFYRYGARRFRDPDNFHDLEFLRSAWTQVNKHAPVQCPLQVLLQCLREAKFMSGPAECAMLKMPFTDVMQPGMHDASYAPPFFNPAMELVRRDSVASQATTHWSTSPRSETGFSESDSREGSSEEDYSDAEDQVPELSRNQPMACAPLPMPSNTIVAPNTLQQQYAPFPAHPMYHLSHHLPVHAPPTSTSPGYTAPPMQPWSHQAGHAQHNPASAPPHELCEPVCVDAWEVVQGEGLCSADLDAFLDDAPPSPPLADAHPFALSSPKPAKPSRKKNHSLPPLTLLAC